MKSLFRLNLQFFADGGAAAGTAAASSEGGSTANTGENATAAAEQRLRELGVPEDKIRKRASIYASKMPKQTVSTPVTAEAQKEAEEVVSAPTNTDNPTEEKKDATATTSTRMTWDEIMADPEYNKQMQATMSNRLKSAKSAEENLAKLAPALEMLAAKYNLDPSKLDYAALTKAIEDDDDYYEDKALEMGVTADVAKKLERLERESARNQQIQQQTLEQQRFAQHYQSLQNQSVEMKKTFPSFDLDTELKNPTFARMTSPNGGISVADAYYAIHRKEIQAAAMQATAQQTAEKLSNAIQAGTRRPDESGTSGQAPSVNTFDYRKATPEQRAKFKADLRSQWAQGKKVFPGQ